MCLFDIVLFILFNESMVYIINSFSFYFGIKEIIFEWVYVYANSNFLILIAQRNFN